MQSTFRTIRNYLTKDNTKTFQLRSEDDLFSFCIGVCGCFLGILELEVQNVMKDAKAKEKDAKEEDDAPKEGQKYLFLHGEFIKQLKEYFNSCVEEYDFLLEKDVDPVVKEALEFMMTYQAFKVNEYAMKLENTKEFLKMDLGKPPQISSKSKKPKAALTYIAGLIILYYKRTHQTHENIKPLEAVHGIMRVLSEKVYKDEKTLYLIGLLFLANLDNVKEKVNKVIPYEYKYQDEPQEETKTESNMSLEEDQPEVEQGPPEVEQGLPEVEQGLPEESLEQAEWKKKNHLKIFKQTAQEINKILRYFLERVKHDEKFIRATKEKLLNFKSLRSVWVHSTSLQMNDTELNPFVKYEIHDEILTASKGAADAGIDESISKRKDMYTTMKKLDTFLKRHQFKPDYALRDIEKMTEIVRMIIKFDAVDFYLLAQMVLYTMQSFEEFLNRKNSTHTEKIKSYRNELENLLEKFFEMYTIGDSTEDNFELFKKGVDIIIRDKALKWKPMNESGNGQGYAVAAKIGSDEELNGTLADRIVILCKNFKRYYFSRNFDEAIRAPLFDIVKEMEEISQILDA